MLIQISQNENEVAFWHKIMLYILIIFAAVILHFYMELTRTKIKNIIKILIYLLAIVIIYFIYSEKNIFSSIQRNSNGFWIFTEYLSINFSIYMIYVTAYPLIIIFLLYNWANKSKLNKEKKQAKIIIISTIVTIGISDFSDIVMSHFDFYKIPHILPLMFLFYFVALCYTLVKYSFLKFNISDLTKEIISNVQDMIIILSPDKTILETNNNFEKTFTCTSNDLLNRKFDELIVFDENLNKKLDDLFNGKLSSFSRKIIYKYNPENIITDSYVSRITDNFKDFIGILIVSKENQGINQFRKLYKISTRQMEIILLSIEGISNIEISEKLKITRRTVETHLFSIYSKLGIKNKVELMKLTNKFNLT